MRNKFIFGIVLCTCLGLVNHFFRNDDKKIKLTKDEAYSLLSSFDNYSLEEEAGITTYSCSKPILKKTRNGRIISKEKIIYNVESLNEVGVTTVTADVVDLEGKIETEEIFYAYPTIDDENNYDVNIDVHGTVLSASSLINNKYDFDKSISIIDIKYNLNIVGEIAKIVFSLSTYEEANALASKYVTIPKLTIDNPLPYFFYIAKLELTKRHYKHNKELEQPTTYIDNQNSYDYLNSEYIWAKFKFGFIDKDIGNLEACNIANKGCGIIAVFNALIECGIVVNFASLIALYELCGSDLLLGYFGVNPVEEQFGYLAANALCLSYEVVLLPLLQLAITTIEPMLYALCVVTPLDLLVPGISLTAAVTAVTTLKILITNTTETVTKFLVWYCTFLKSETTMMKIIFGTEHIKSYSIGNWDNFFNDYRKYKQAIICYFNSYERKEDKIKINVKKGAHYIYLSKEIKDNKIKVESHNNAYNNGPYEYSDLLQFMKDKSLDGVKEQFIWGYIIK